MDLFGDTFTQPHCAGLQKRLLNAAHGFTEFWDAWPRHTRKVAKQQCLDKWARLHCADEATLIVAHVRWMQTQDDWLRDQGRYIPAPLVYLNQRRWDGWEPEPERPKRADPLEEIKNHKGSAIPPEIRAKMAQLRGK